MDKPLLDQPAPELETSPEEVAGRLRFRRNRMLANGLLATMGAIFVGTHFIENPGFFTHLVRAGSEAGVVGGLADWFAVTALFRHPLGLPIPHTAIIPRSKNRIGDSLGGFIERHFLTHEIVTAKLRQLRVGRRFALWLARPSSTVVVTDAIVKSLPYVLRSVASPDLREFASRTLGEQLRQADVAPIAARVLRALATGGEADALFDHGIALASRLLDDNRPMIERLVQERSQWWIPKAIDRRISAAIISGLADLLHRLQEPGSEARARFRAAIEEFIHALETSPEQQANVNAAKNRLLEHPDVKAWLGSIWEDLSNLALKDLENPSSNIRQAVERAVSLFGKTLKDDGAMQEHIDRAIERVSLYMIAWRGQISTFFTDVVKNWDTHTLTERLENVVGSDLQYIRMNGTVVGALVGCLLFLGTQLLP